jgi:hypothetical protein
MPHLNKPQATVLALCSFGMVLTQACDLTSIAAVLGRLLQQKSHTVRRGYKATNHGGWHWEQTKLDDPARAARRWLVMAVATR